MHFRGFTYWGHRERLWVSCSYHGELCHLCSRFLLQIPISTEPAALAAHAKDSGSTAELPNQKSRLLQPNPPASFLINTCCPSVWMNLLMLQIDYCCSRSSCFQALAFVHCHCTQCLMVPLLFFNLCCKGGLILLHLVQLSAHIDRPFLFVCVDFSGRSSGARTPWPHSERHGCSLVVAIETKTSFSGELCFCSQIHIWCNQISLFSVHISWPFCEACTVLSSLFLSLLSPLFCLMIYDHSIVITSMLAYNV